MHLENRLTHNWLAKKLTNDAIRAHLGLVSGLVLDLGCGIRPYEAEVRSYAKHYFGLDWSNSLHSRCMDVIADVGKPLPVLDQAVDCVVAFEVLEHLPEPQFALQEMYRILRDGGLLLISVPFQWHVHEAPWDFFRFTRYGLEHLLGKSGFQDVVITEKSGFWAMWVLKFNYQTYRLTRGPSWRGLPIKLALIPIWWLNQKIAPILDRIWPSNGESTGYIVTARKPCL